MKLNAILENVDRKQLLQLQQDLIEYFPDEYDVQLDKGQLVIDHPHFWEPIRVPSETELDDIKSGAKLIRETDTITITCDSSQDDTDSVAFSKALQKLIPGSTVSFSYPDDEDEEDYDEDAYRPPNAGQFTQRFVIELTKPMSMHDFEGVMDKLYDVIDKHDCYGFANGYEINGVESD